MLKQLHKKSEFEKVKVEIIKDSLKEIVNRQLALQKRLSAKNVANFGIFDKLKISKKNINNLLYNIMCLQQELAEIIDFLPYKKWKHYSKKDYITTEKGGNLNLFEIKLEVIDCLHFLINLFLILGMNSDNILKLYIFKNKVNHKRQDNNY